MYRRRTDSHIKVTSNAETDVVALACVCLSDVVGEVGAAGAKEVDAGDVEEAAAGVVVEERVPGNGSSESKASGPLDRAARRFLLASDECSLLLPRARHRTMDACRLEAISSPCAQLAEFGRYALPRPCSVHARKRMRANDDHVSLVRKDAMLRAVDTHARAWPRENSEYEHGHSLGKRTGAAYATLRRCTLLGNPASGLSSRSFISEVPAEMGEADRRNGLPSAP